MTRRATELLAHHYPDACAILLTTSCTHALGLAALTLDVRADDEVIVPAFTFVSTANAFTLRGARIRFAEILPDTLSSIPSRWIRSSPSTGVSSCRCTTPALRVDGPHHGERGSRVGATVVEDNAHGLFGRVDGRALGTSVR